MVLLPYETRKVKDALFPGQNQRGRLTPGLQKYFQEKAVVNNEWGQSKLWEAPNKQALGKVKFVEKECEENDFSWF